MQGQLLKPLHFVAPCVYVFRKLTIPSHSKTPKLKNIIKNSQKSNFMSRVFTRTAERSRFNKQSAKGDKNLEIILLNGNASTHFQQNTTFRSKVSSFLIPKNETTATTC
jgi:hypothetical protein